MADGQIGLPIKMIPHREVRQGRLGMSDILSDLLLFSCLAAFVAGIVVAAASLLS
jgi:hypothetical protein